MLILWPPLSLSFPISEMSGSMEKTLRNLIFQGWIQFQMFRLRMYLLGPRGHIAWMSYQWGSLSI